MLRVDNSHKGYESVNSVSYCGWEPPETTVAQSFTALLELAAQLHPS
jgi:hypothetical protein